MRKSIIRTYIDNNYSFNACSAWERERGREMSWPIQLFVQQRRFHMDTVHLLGPSSFPVAQKHV